MSVFGDLGTKFGEQPKLEGFRICCVGLQDETEVSRRLKELTRTVSETACKLANEAVARWASQFEVTPEEFLRFFEPKTELQFDPPQLHISVRPVLRGEAPPWRIEPRLL
jgi:hypothetical protein